MQYFKREKITGLLAALVMFIGGTSSALAVGTESGTTVTNTATVNYAVGGTGRSANGSVDFLIDNRVDLTVTGGTAINVAPGSTNQVLVFTVDNTGNTAQGYEFSVEAPGTPVLTNVRVYIDDPDSGTIGSFDGADPLYTPGATGNFANLFAGGEFDIGATANAGLNHDTGAGGGQTQVTVFIVADTPAAAADGASDTYHLIATTLDVATDTVTTASGAPTGSLVTADVVFADIAGSHTGAAANNGIHSASGTYTVATAQLAVTKSIANVADEFVATGGYEIPGAVVRYSVVVDNTGGTATDAGLVLSDPIPTNTKVCYAVGARCAAADLPTFNADTSGLGASVDPLGFQYSNDSGATWAYVPTADADGADTAVTNIRYRPAGAMNAAVSSFNITFGVVIE